MTEQRTQTAVLDVRGMHRASEKSVVEHSLGARPGVLAVEANPVAQTANVTYDPDTTSVAELTGWVRDCGFHCAGQSCPPMSATPCRSPRRDGPRRDGSPREGPRGPSRPCGHVHGGHGARHAEPLPGR